jgi:hypothetical protein
MAHFDGEVTSRPKRVAWTEPDVSKTFDAVGIELLVRCDGDDFQYLNPMVTGPTLRLELNDLVGDARLWPAVAHSACDRLPALMSAGSIPLDVPGQAYLVPIDASTVRPYLDQVEPGDVEGLRFEADF